jgi:tetratricopeptide (TPR) repeat protein
MRLRRLLAAAVLAGGCRSTPALPFLDEPPAGAPRTVGTTLSLDAALREIETMLAGPDEQIDVARASLVMSSVLEPVDLDARLREIDAMARDLRPQIAEQTDPREQVRLLAEYLHGRVGYRYVTPKQTAADPRWIDNHRWMSQLMATRMGVCNSLATLYVAIGHRLGLPLKPVVLPQHIYVRYEDDRVRLNIETTAGGALTSDEEYVRLVGKWEAPCYGRGLTRREFLATQLANHLAVAMRHARDADALRCLDLALKVMPEFSDAWVNRGIALRRLGHPEEALKSYDRALRIDGLQGAAHYNRANVLRDLGRYPAALEAYARACVCRPSDAKYLAARAGMLALVGRNDEALQIAELAIEAAGDDADAWLAKATALGNLRRDEEAIAWYDKALEGGQRDAIVWSNRGNSLVRLGRYADAIESYAEALKLKPEYGTPWTGTGVALSELGRTEEARTAFERACRVAPRDARMWLNKAEFHVKRGEAAAARNCLQKLVELKFEVPDELRARVEALEK